MFFSGGAQDRVSPQLQEVPPQRHRAHTQSRRDHQYKMSAFNFKDEDSPNTPLYHTAQAGNARVVEFLLLRRARPDADDTAANSVGSPLALELSRRSAECMRFLLDAGASTEIPSRRGWTILAEAIYFEYEDGVKVQLEYGALPDLPSYWSKYDNLLDFTI